MVKYIYIKGGHDGATSHTSRETMALIATELDGRKISRNEKKKESELAI